MKKILQKAEMLRQEAIEFLTQYDKDYRIKSEHFLGTVIPVTYEEIQYNLEGGRYLSEVDIQNKKIIDNSGYQYDLSILSDHQLFTIVDTIQENNEKYEIWKEAQTEIFYKIQDAGFNIVTCGNCGEVILHAINNDDEVHCGGCRRDMAKSDCPDLYS